MPDSSKVNALLSAAKILRDAVGTLTFKSPIAFAYNPLDYAWPAHVAYIRNFGHGAKRFVFLGMNPGPFGMVQTGVPFGEIGAVRDWMGIEAEIGKPRLEHPARPVSGFACHRSEVSGRRLWGLFKDHFDGPEAFFFDHFVVNYCPLAFFDCAGRNLTPDKLPASQRETLFRICDEHLVRVVDILQPRWLIAVGGFALRRARCTFPEPLPHVGNILHPSPASPAANKNWAEKTLNQLRSQCAWPY